MSNQPSRQYNNRQARPDTNETIINNWANLQTPYDEPSEQGVCGAVMVGGFATYRQCAAVLQTQDFFLLRLRYVWEAFERCVGQGQDIDYLTVCAALKDSGRLAEIGGPAHLTQLVNMSVSHLHGLSYAYTVRLCGIRRRGMAFADQIKTGCVDTTVGIHISMAQMAADFNNWMAELPNTTTETAEKVSNDILQDLNNPLQMVPAIKSGIKAYDDLIGGFTPSNVYLFGADAGMGKSSLVQNFVVNNPDMRVAYFSTEMDHKAIMARLLKILTGISQRMIREQILSPVQKQLVATALAELARRPIHIDYSKEKQLSPEMLKARAMQIKGAHGLDLLIVDHVTDMAPAAGFEKAQLEEKQGSIALELKLLANALKIPILAVVQLNRQVRDAAESRPNKSHIRGSGRWEQLAAVITLLYREEVYNPATEFPNSAELIVDKVRDDGETGIVRTYTDKTRNLYSNGATHTVHMNGYDYSEDDRVSDVDF